MKIILHQLRLGRTCQIGEFTITWSPAGDFCTRDCFGLTQARTGLSLLHYGKCTAANFLTILRQAEDIPLLSQESFDRHPNIRAYV